MGGAPVRSRSWPRWPPLENRLQLAATEALQSGRWTITGPWTGKETIESEFAAAFARYIGVKYCIATDHGSSSLLLALEALDIGFGDEVIVPTLTWVATASAVVSANALPVLVDVDPETGCISPEEIAAAITSRTRAVIPVHLHCTMADMDAITGIAKANGIDVIEDCAQSHGARWNDRSAGSIGRLGTFSMQQGKVLTAGEGGAVTTDDESLYERLQQLRTDGRMYGRRAPRTGEFGLTEVGDVMGTNACLTEMQAAILLASLDHLDEEIEHRQRNARYLDSHLEQLGLKPLRHAPQLTRQSIYEYAVVVPEEVVSNADPDVVCWAITCELGTRVYRTDAPLHLSVLYRPWTKRRHRIDAEYERRLSTEGLRFPAAEHLYERLTLIHHSALLGSKEDMDDVIAAFDKVIQCSAQLRNVSLTT